MKNKRRAIKNKVNKLHFNWLEDDNAVPDEKQFSKKYYK
jgi:hypothetical protein